MTLGERIKELRKRLKLNQVTFGEKIGLKVKSIQNTVTRFETDARMPDLTTLLKISEVGDIDPGFLMTGNQPKINWNLIKKALYLTEEIIEKKSHGRKISLDKKFELMKNIYEWIADFDDDDIEKINPEKLGKLLSFNI